MRYGLRKLVGPAILGASLAAIADEPGIPADEESGSVTVMPMASFAAPPTGELAAFCDRVYRSAELQARYLLGEVHPWDRDPTLLLLTESRSDEHWIRPNTGAVAGFAFLYRFGPYDEACVGVSRRRLMHETIIPMMRYLVATHRTGVQPTGDDKPWGDHWQSALWAHALGRSAWWVWDDLPDDVRAGVRRVVAHEADRIAGAAPPSRVDSDTKAEENAWNSTILSVATLLLPDDERRPGWDRAFQKWALSSFLRAADAESEALVDGRPLRDQFTGANIHDDFTLENHDIVHPDYMTTFGLTLGTSIDFAMTGRTMPEALLHNVGGIYENLKWFILPDGGFVYPSGQDWRLFRNVDWLFAHILMAVYAGDAEAWPLAELALDTQELMQARSESGAVYAPDEYFFPSTQHDTLYRMALVWLTLQPLATLPDHQPYIPKRLGVRRLDAGRILIRRTPEALHTLSWGRGLMAQCVANRKDRLVSPHPRSGVGHIRLKGAAKPLPVTLREIRTTDSPDGFSGEAVVDHGVEQIEARLTYVSRPDGTWVIREELKALADLETAEIATGLIGILNNRQWVYEPGRRRIVLGTEAAQFESCAGGSMEVVEVTHAVIDGVMVIRSATPLRVRYLAARESERGRVTDLLYLNYRGDERSWRAGDTIRRFEAEVRCLPGRESR